MILLWAKLNVIFPKYPLIGDKYWIIIYLSQKNRRCNRETVKCNFRNQSAFSIRLIIHTVSTTALYGVILGTYRDNCEIPLYN